LAAGRSFGLAVELTAEATGELMAGRIEELSTCCSVKLTEALTAGMSTDEVTVGLATIISVTLSCVDGW
jgi:hypothetical protein